MSGREVTKTTERSIFYQGRLPPAYLNLCTQPGWGAFAVDDLGRRKNTGPQSVGRGDYLDRRAGWGHKRKGDVTVGQEWRTDDRGERRARSKTFGSPKVGNPVQAKKPGEPQPRIRKSSAGGYDPGHVRIDTRGQKYSETLPWWASVYGPRQRTSRGSTRFLRARLRISRRERRRLVSDAKQRDHTQREARPLTETTMRPKRSGQGVPPADRSTITSRSRRRLRRSLGVDRAYSGLGLAFGPHKRGVWVTYRTVAARSDHRGSGLGATDITWPAAAAVVARAWSKRPSRQIGAPGCSREGIRAYHSGGRT